jgi:hypothetical protein
MIKNLGETIEALKPHLKKYLLAKGTQFKGRLFQCPNRNAHRNQDVKPGCNFLDKDESKFYCYVCGATGDIFDAVHLLENRQVTGAGFHDTVEYLCKITKVPYALAEDTPESQFMQEVESFLDALVSRAHTNLKNLVTTEPTHPAVKLLQTKGWLGSVDTYRLGIIQAVKEPKVQKLKDVCNFLNLNLNDLVNGIIIPIEFKHKLIGFQIRATELNTLSGMKYKTYLSTNKGLFNLDNIDPSQTVYMVEGASSIIVMHNYGLDNAVATLGNGINDAHYEALITKDIKDVCLMYDNDDGGDIGRKRACETFVGKNEIKLSFKLLTKENDPADFLLANHKFDELPTLSLWDYLLHKGYKELMLKYVAAQQDLIDKERLVGILSKELDVTKAVLMEEIHKYESTLSEVPTIMSLKEKESIIETINSFEKWAWSRGELLGIKSFDCFDKSFDGLQEGLILVGGAPNVGKSALTTSIACRIMETTANAYIIYLSIDDSAIITTARFLANLSGIPINIVSNPKHRIVDNKYYTDAEKKDLMVRREKALEYMRKHVAVFNLKDASSGYTIEYLNTLFKSLEPIIKDKKVVLIVDNLHKLRSLKEYKSDKSLVDSVCNNLKILSGIYKCPVIATVEHTKASIQLGEIGGSAIKESSSLHYDANLILTVVVKQVVGAFKLIDVMVSKNKMSTFIGAMPFRLYPDQSKMEECGATQGNFGTNLGGQDGPADKMEGTGTTDKLNQDSRDSTVCEGDPK